MSADDSHQFPAGSIAHTELIERLQVEIKAAPSEAAVARRYGISPQLFSMILSGRRNVSTKVLKANECGRFERAPSTSASGLTCGERRQHARLMMTRMHSLQRVLTAVVVAIVKAVVAVIVLVIVGVGLVPFLLTRAFQRAAGRKRN